MSSAVPGILALVFVIIVIIYLVIVSIFFFIDTPGVLGVTGFTGIGSDTISNLGNKLILYQPSPLATGTPTLKLGSNGGNTTGKTLIIKNNSNLNTSSNSVLITSAGTTITNPTSGTNNLNLPAGSAAWFIFNKQNAVTLIGVVPNGTFST